MDIPKCGVSEESQGGCLLVTTQAAYNSKIQVISARKGGSFLVMTQAVDNTKNRDIGERRGVEAHFHQMTSFH